MSSEHIAIAKALVNIASGMGVSKVVHDVIENNTNVETTADAVKVWTGSVVIGGMVAEHASEHVNRRFDRTVAWFEARKEASQAKKESDR